MTLNTSPPPARLDDPASAVVAGAALIEELNRAGADHVELAAESIRWAHRSFGSLVVMSSMGDEVLVHLTAQAAPGIEVAFIDTGFHFPETLWTAATYATSEPITLLTIEPVHSVAAQDEQYGPRLYERDPDQCCAMRKVEPLERTLSGRQAWITGMRRVDAPTRSDIDIVTFDARRSMVKINPLALWTDAQTQQYAHDHDVLLNPLRQSGYTSIGCAPCTRATAAGEDPRAGRWAGQGKTECGLHV
jgi:phosphoadenosine phosphosulfate reductase